MKWEDKKTDALIMVLFVALIWGIFTVGSLIKPDENGFIGSAKWLEMRRSAEGLLQVHEVEDIYLGSRHELFQKRLPSTYEPGEDGVVALLSQIAVAYPDAQFMLIPTKEAVWEEYLPPFAPNYDQENLYQRLKGVIPTEQLIDIYGLFWEHRREDLYFHSDEHLTGLGTMYLYDTFLQNHTYYPYLYEMGDRMVLRTDFRGNLYREEIEDAKEEVLGVFSETLKRRLMVTYDGGDPVETLYATERLMGEDAYGYYMDGTHAVTEVITGYHAGGRSLILIKDSYANELVPMLVPHYQKMYIIDVAAYEGDLVEYIDSNCEEKTEVMVIGSLTGFFEQ